MAIAAWKENRGGLTPGMKSVINVIVNRSTRDKVTPYTEATRRLQFSSVTAPGDPELVIWALDQDPQWLNALFMAQQAAGGILEDITNGSVDYYAPKALTADRIDPVPYTLPDGTSVPFPKGWNRTKLVFEVEIAGQLFFREN